MGTMRFHPTASPSSFLPTRKRLAGYRVLGTVISADLHLIGQLGPADELGFELVTVAQAQAVLRDRQGVLDTLLYEW